MVSYSKLSTYWIQDSDRNDREHRGTKTQNIFFFKSDIFCKYQKMKCDFIYKNHVLHVHLRPEKRSLTMLSDLSRTPTSNPSVTKVTQLTHYFCLAPPSRTSQPLPSFLRMTPDCRSLFLNSYISDPQTKRSSNVPKMSSHQH